MRRVLIGCLLVRSALPDDEVISCLRGDGPCDPARACDARRPPARACLEAPVAWRTPYATVRCCFKCCLRHWTDALGLADAKAAWPASAKYADDEVLLYSETAHAWAPLRARWASNRSVLAPSGAPLARAFAAFEKHVPDEFPAEWDARAERWPGAVVVAADTWAAPRAAWASRPRGASRDSTARTRPRARVASGRAEPRRALPPLAWGTPACIDAGVAPRGCR